MKTHTFTVTLTFEDKITSDSEIAEMVQNIAIALKNGTDGYGLVPEASETFTRKIEVTSEVAKVTKGFVIKDGMFKEI